MTKRALNKHKREIFETVQISYAPTLKSSLALAFSGAISTFGIYSIIDGAVTGDNLFYALGVFILILIVADTFKRGALSRYYNSIIRTQITQKGKVLKLQLAVFFLALSFMVMFDFIGSFSTANFIEQKYQDYRATSSKEFELLEQKAQTGKDINSNYTLELQTWKEEKAEEITRCATRNRTDKFRTKCLDKWKAKNQKPTNPKADTTVKISDYKDMKSDVNDDFLSRNIYHIVLFLSMAITLLLQYSTISEIQDERDEIDEMLTPQLMGTLNDRLLILETNAVEHEAERNELIRVADKAHKNEERSFEELGEGMKVISLQKATTARGETLKRIANNSYVPTEKSKAGFVKNPMYREPQEQGKEPKGENGVPTYDLKNSTIAGYQLAQFKALELGYGSKKYYELDNRQLRALESHMEAKGGLDYIVYYDDVKQVCGESEEELIYRLYNDNLFDFSEEHIGNDLINKLTPKNKVININKRSESQMLSNLYKRLIKLNVVELRGNKGYYALKSYHEALQAYREEGAK
jgi:hypothetical protein